MSVWVIIGANESVHLMQFTWRFVFKRASARSSIGYCTSYPLSSAKRAVSVLPWSYRKLGNPRLGRRDQGFITSSMVYHAGGTDTNNIKTSHQLRIIQSSGYMQITVSTNQQPSNHVYQQRTNQSFVAHPPSWKPLNFRQRNERCYSFCPYISSLSQSRIAMTSSPQGNTFVRV